ncbi:MAG: exo-alpha-sialidase [Planctomycetes bacterium]|nr:exo-alpha-sialidase [Planctomycetota bacterium]
MKHPIPDPPDYSRYPAGLAGYTGMNLNEIALWTRRPATRSRIGRRGLYKTGLVQLFDATVLATPSYRGEDRQMHLTVFQSRDEGLTWSQVETRGEELLGQEHALVCLQDGSLLLYNGRAMLRSGDRGVTWETCHVFDAEMVRNVLEDPDGGLTLLMTKGTYYPLSHPDAPPCQGWIFRSRDGGRTWKERGRVKMWDSPESMFPEAALIRLRDGRILAAGRVSGDHAVQAEPPPRGRPTPPGDESGDQMLLAESEDGGLTWSPPRPFLGYSEVHAHLLRLQDGRLLCSYASYHLPYGVFAVLSEDDGQTWDRDHPILLAMSLNCYTGWPTSIQLAGGDILTAYAKVAYLEGEGVSLMNRGKNDTVAEAVRWALP